MLVLEKTITIFHANKTNISVLRAAVGVVGDGNNNLMRLKSLRTFARSVSDSVQTFAAVSKV